MFHSIAQSPYTAAETLQKHIYAPSTVVKISNLGVFHTNPMNA